MNPEIFKDYLLELQSSMCDKLQALEKGERFIQDSWQREQGGGGKTCVLQGGEVFESAGVNFSHVYGSDLPPSATATRPELAGRSFQAMGVSSVIHPKNPFVPTAHMNVRLFVAQKPGADPVWWFGGGFDLTPFYPKTEDCVSWHSKILELCRPYGEEVYPKYKKWADEYFYLPHRKEPRGIGGLFFDDLNEAAWGWDYNKCLAFTQDVGRRFLMAYLPIVLKNHQQPYTQTQRDFQCYRRGRYVEFNLVYDRGTLFGLQSGGRTESILMSLPPNVKWGYDFSNTEANKKLCNFLSFEDWVSQDNEKALAQLENI